MAVEWWSLRFGKNTLEICMEWRALGAKPESTSSEGSVLRA